MNRLNYFWMLMFTIVLIASTTLSSCGKDDDETKSTNNETEQPKDQDGNKPDDAQIGNDGFINAASLADTVANLGVGHHELKVNGELSTTTLNSIGEILRTKYSSLIIGYSTTKKTSVASEFSVDLDLSETTGLIKLESGVSADGATYTGLAGCSALTALKLPKTLIEIESNAVGYCINLTNVTIPESVKTIADGSFFGCYKLEKNEKFPNLRGMVIEATDLGEKIKELTKGEYFIQVVGAYDNEWENEYAFYDNCSDKGIYIYLDIADVDASKVNNFEGTDAFKGNWLKAIVWAKTAPLTEWKFSGGVSLNTVVIPASVTTIECYGLFHKCDNLKNIIIAAPLGWKRIFKQKNETTGSYEEVEEPVDKLNSDMLKSGNGDKYVKDK